MKPLFLALVLLANLFGADEAIAQARITRLSKEVKVARASRAAQAAFSNEPLASGSSIHTGAGAQAELRLANGALVRLGQNSLFRLRDGVRRGELLRGAILIRAERNSGETQIVTGSAVSSVTGTTSLIEYYPDAYTKLISLDGTARMFMPSIVGESVLVNAGQLLMFHLKPAPRGLPNPVDIDINRLAATSLLIKGFGPLGNAAAIQEGARAQKKQKSTGALADTNLVIFGRGTLVSLVPPTAEENAKQSAAKPTASPTATPRPRR